MANWTIIGKGIEGDTTDKAFGISLDTNKGQWAAVGPSVQQFFVSLAGDFKIVGVPESGTQLVNANGSEAAFLKALNGSTSLGATGTGRASEMGVNFSWKLDSL